jgi:integrase
VIQICGQVFRYAIACEHCEYDPTQPIRGPLEPVRPGHFASVTRPADVGQLLRSVDAYPHPVVRHAMQFSALVFLRPGEVRHTEWTEIDGDELRIPGEKMKMKRPHIVPLARQTVELLQKMKQLTGHGKYVFPSNRSPKGDRPMSENTVLVALRSMGYEKDQMTAHGFRSMASTLLNENGFNRDWIERQLAHVEGNGVRAAYNYAEYLPERRKMMQWWADYLDGLWDG